MLREHALPVAHTLVRQRGAACLPPFTERCGTLRHICIFFLGGWLFSDLREILAKRVFEPLYGTRELHSSKEGFTFHRPTAPVAPAGLSQALKPHCTQHRPRTLVYTRTQNTVACHAWAPNCYQNAGCAESREWRPTSCHWHDSSLTLHHTAHVGCCINKLCRWAAPQPLYRTATRVFRSQHARGAFRSVRGK